VTPRTRLLPVHVPTTPAGAVLVLHGGAGRRETSAVSPTQLSVLRMVPVARRIARAGRDRLAVFRLLNSSRGWDEAHTPVADVGWALAQLRSSLGADVPVCLVGHSLGGRAALLAADQRGVASVVALNPWVHESDARKVSVPPGRPVLVVHGDEDRVASPRRSAVVAAALRRTTDVGYVSVRGGRHAMLRHGATFERVAADFATATLLGDEPHPPVDAILAGTDRVEV
jgi:pimeloyl-ACP methyl ester carboxylesterase